MENKQKLGSLFEAIKKKKLLIIILGFTIYILILALVIVPLQGGLLSSTEIYAPGESGSAFPIQEILGTYGRSIMIAFVMLTHVLFANLHLGGSWLAVTSESFSIKFKQERFRRLARSITLFNVILFSFGATFAAAGVLFFFSFVPEFAALAFNIFFWPLFIEIITFFLEVFFLYVYWFSWDKVSNKSHQFLGYGYAITVFIQTFMINMLASAMLTPGENLDTTSFANLYTWWFNPSLWALTFHRFVAAISVVGFILAMLALYHYKDRKDQASKKYWDWVASYGLIWGIGGLILQPLIGIMYINQLFYYENPTFQMIMHGPRAWEMLLMVSLFSALFLVLIVYYIDRKEEILNREENARYKKLFNVFLILALIATFFLVQPSWIGGTFEFGEGSVFNPLGIMAIKYVALLILMLIGILIVAIDFKMLKKMEENEWGRLSNTSRYAGILAGMLGILIVIVMGYTRETARAPYIIFGLMPFPQSTSNPTPISIDQIFIVWALIMGLILLVFWLTSKKTAYHPQEKAELYGTTLENLPKRRPSD